MSYAVDWDSLSMEFSPKLPQYPNSREYWKLRYVAIGARNVQNSLETTYGYLWGVTVVGSFKDSYLYSPSWYKDYFIENYDPRYGISWVAKLSGTDDIKLANSHSFSDYEYYWGALAEHRRVIHSGSTPGFFEGWYVNA